MNVFTCSGVFLHCRYTSMSEYSVHHCTYDDFIVVDRSSICSLFFSGSRTIGFSVVGSVMCPYMFLASISNWYWITVLSLWVLHQSLSGPFWPGLNESAAVKWPSGLPELCQWDYTSKQASNLAANPD